jgi:hypothetical protein
MTMAQEEYYSFEDVLKDLEIGEDELKRMVSEGELRAFRDENKMKFRRDDVENLRKGRTSEPTLILPAQDMGDGGGSDAAETILDLDAPAQDDEAGPAIELPGGEGAAGSDTQDVTKQLDFTDTDITVADEPVTAEVGDVEEGTTTEPLQLVDEGATEAVPTEEEGEAVGVAAAPRKRGRTIEITEADEEALEARRPSWIWSFILLVSFVVTTYAGFFTYDLLRIQSGRAAKPTGLTEKLAKMFTDSFYNDGQWKARIKIDRTTPPNTIPNVFSQTAPWQFTTKDREDAEKGIKIEDSMKSSDRAPSGDATPAPTAAPAATEKKEGAEKPVEK